MNGEILSQAEATALDECEIVIERGIKSFIEVGRALVRIRDAKLYRTTYATFEEYATKRWRLARPTAYNMIDAARVADAIEGSDADDEPVYAMADIPLPANERQARPLTRLLPKRDAPPAEQQQARRVIRETWAEARSSAPSGRPTAAQVAEAVARRRSAADVVGQQMAAVPSNADLDAELDQRMAQTAERFRSEFATAMAKADDVMTFDMERVAEVIDRDRLRQYLRSWRRWCDEIEGRIKPGLRVVGGS